MASTGQKRASLISYTGLELLRQMCSDGDSGHLLVLTDFSGEKVVLSFECSLSFTGVPVCVCLVFLFWVVLI